MIIFTLFLLFVIVLTVDEKHCVLMFLVFIFKSTLNKVFYSLFYSFILPQSTWRGKILFMF